MSLLCKCLLNFFIIGVIIDDSDLEGYNSQEERRAGAKKKRYSQKYSKEFETDLQLKNWIKPSSKGKKLLTTVYAMFTLN